MAYQKTVLDVMRLATEKIFPPYTKPLPIKTSPLEPKLIVRLILEEAINDLNDWLAKGKSPCENNIESDLAGVFINKLKTSFRYNGGKTLYPDLSIHSIYTGDIRMTFDTLTRTYTLEFVSWPDSYAYVTEKSLFLKDLRVALATIGNPNKCIGHTFKSLHPFYKSIQDIKNM